MTLKPTDTPRPVADLEAKYRATEGVQFLTGVQASARIVLDQMRADRDRKLRTAAFVSGYPGSPLARFDQELEAHRSLFESLDVVHRPGVNEELAATAVMGSQLASTYPTPRFDGVVGIWYGKSPGLDRASDAIRHAGYAGTSSNGGVLALVGDDPSNKSSTLPSASEHALADLEVPTLFPGTVQEVLDLGLHGIALSRAAGLWAGLKLVTAVADGFGAADVTSGRLEIISPEVEWRGKPFRPTVRGWLAGQTANSIEKEIFEIRTEVALQYSIANRLNRITVNPADAWLGIAASGYTYQALLEALRALGLAENDLQRHGIRLLKISMLYPFDASIARQFATGLDEVFVVEEKRPFIETHLRDSLYGMSAGPTITGKRDDHGERLIATSGALDADSLIDPLRRRLLTRISVERLAEASTRSVTSRPRIELPRRTPYFCSGCPHSTSLQVPPGSLVGAGIGCHGLISFMSPERVGTVTGVAQMGGEGAQWIGVEQFVDDHHYIQNMGDGTFHHSGSLAVRAAVAAGANVTYKILFNHAVAMTGGQDPVGAMSLPNLVTTLRSEGVARVIVTTDDLSRYRGVKLHGAEVWHRDRIIEAQQRLAEEPGVTVLVHDQECAAEKRRDRKRGLIPDPPQRIVINDRVCEGCGDCGLVSNCLSVYPVDTEFGRKTEIDQSSCNRDYTCVKGDCPSFLTVVPKKRSRRAAALRRSKRQRRQIPQFDLAELTEPALIVPPSVAVRITGIGGTGVVTVSQVLGMAATIDGKHVSGVDQTGLSQKAGPVVSDLRISTTPVVEAGRIAAGSADLYLVFDLLVGLEPHNLMAASPLRTVAVASTSKTPTGVMVRNVDATYPDAATLRDQLSDAVRVDESQLLDTADITTGLLGSSTTANMLQIGVAYQIGALPLSATAIEQAITLNGAAVEANLWAFRWGRMWAINPDRVNDAAMSPGVLAPGPPAWLAETIRATGVDEGELGRLVRLRATDLVRYQGDSYARAYVLAVGRAHETGYSTFAEAVARNQYKLMAYKDEYEVARLHLETATRALVERAIGPDVVVSWNLHPPVLRALGLKHKLRLGPWFTPIMKLLRAGRRLRGTRADPFGYTKIRRMERALIQEYSDTIDAVCKKVNDDNYRTAVELAELPDMVRGYENIKVAAVKSYRVELARLRASL